MAVQLDFVFKKGITIPASSEKTFTYLSDYEKHFPACFKGTESFTKIADHSYQWKFQKFELAGLSFQFGFQVKFLEAKPRIQMKSLTPTHDESIEAQWDLTSESQNLSRLGFSMTVRYSLPAPSLTKRLILPVVEKELTHFLERYLHHVEKNIPL